MLRRHNCPAKISKFQWHDQSLGVRSLIAEVLCPVFPVERTSAVTYYFVLPRSPVLHPSTFEILRIFSKFQSPFLAVSLPVSSTTFSAVAHRLAVIDDVGRCSISIKDSRQFRYAHSPHLQAIDAWHLLERERRSVGRIRSVCQRLRTSTRWHAVFGKALERVFVRACPYFP